MEARSCLRILRRSPLGVYPSYNLLPAVSPRVPRRSLTTRTESSIVVQEDHVNPPRTTLPPPLELPARDPQVGRFKHLFRQGKAYVSFYKTGLKNVFANRTIINAKVALLPEADRPSVFKPRHVPATFSRADWVLLWRVRHDVSRLPVFAVVLLLFEELTPLIAYYFDGIMPYTCRLPGHIEKARNKSVIRRERAFEELGQKHPAGVPTASVAKSHILRSLGLISPHWDRIGWVPSGLWKLKGNSQMAFLEGDDVLLRQFGGVEELSRDELVLACSQRGLDINTEEAKVEETSVQEKKLKDMGHFERKRLLEQWLSLTDAQTARERRRRMVVLLTSRVEHWPEGPDFALPDWDI